MSRVTNVTDRAVAAFLLLLMTLGALALWIGVPAAGLWVTGRLAEEPAQQIALSLAVVPLGMIAWARFLFWLNRLYLRVVEDRWAVEGGEGSEDDEPRWLRGPLEPLLVGSLLIALVAMTFWFLVLAESPNAAPW